MVKVGKKIFVFVGDGITVKLVDPALNAHAMALPGAEPTGYGLGASGWVNVPVGARTSWSLLCDFIEESYRTVAPKKLVAQLDAHGQDPGSASAPRGGRRVP